MANLNTNHVGKVSEHVFTKEKLSAMHICGLYCKLEIIVNLKDIYFEIQYPVGNADGAGCVHSSLIYHDHDEDFFV